MKRLFLFIALALSRCFAGEYSTVMVDPTGKVVRPANFQAVNPPSGQGVASNYVDGTALSDTFDNFYLPTGKRLANGSGSLYFPTAAVNGGGFFADNNEDVYFGQNPSDYSKKAFDHLGNWYFANGYVWGKKNGVVSFTNSFTATNPANLFGGDGSRLTGVSASTGVNLSVLDSVTVTNVLLHTYIKMYDAVSDNGYGAGATTNWYIIDKNGTFIEFGADDSFKIGHGGTSANFAIQPNGQIVMASGGNAGISISDDYGSVLASDGNGSLTLSGGGETVNVSADVNGQTFNGTFSGDGSGLSGVSAQSADSLNQKHVQTVDFIDGNSVDVAFDGGFTFPSSSYIAYASDGSDFALSAINKTTSGCRLFVIGTAGGSGDNLIEVTFVAF